MEDLGEVGVLAHPVAAAADVDDMAVMQQAIDERSGHDLVAQDLAPLLVGFIGVGEQHPPVDPERQPFTHPVRDLTRARRRPHQELERQLPSPKIWPHSS